MSENAIKSVAQDFKSLLIKSQKRISRKNKTSKQYAAIVKASKAEYQKKI